MEKYLVTGGAGFIGSNIVETLLARKKKVRVLDNFLTGKKENLAPFLNKIELIKGDIRNKKTVSQALKGVDYVMHLAALPSVIRSVDNPQLSNDINVCGTLNLLEACKASKVKRFIFSSSSSVYGGRAPLPVKENCLLCPISPYGVSKLTGEYYSRIFYELYGLETISLRYFNVFGPRQNPSSQYAAVIPKFITAMLQNKNPVIFGDGEQSRDFTYVSNVVAANIKACTVPKKALGKAFNIACGQSINLNQLVSLINSILNKKIKSSYTKERAGDIKHSLAANQEAKKYLKFEPAVTFEQGLKTTAKWFVTHNRGLK